MTNTLNEIPVTGKSQMLGIDQAFANGWIEELLLIKTGNEKKRILRFYVPAFQQRKKPGSRAGRITGSFFAFLFPLKRFRFREPFFLGGRLLESSCQMWEKKS